MKEYIALFRSVPEIGAFVAIANQQPFPIRIRDGENVFDAKSILGLFDVHLNVPLTVCVDDRFADTQPFVDAIASYIDAARCLE